MSRDHVNRRVHIVFALVNSRSPVLPVFLRLMSRWLTNDLLTMPLGKIESEIERIKSKSTDARSVIDVDYLADLHEAKRRILTRRA